jgi:hypothetical protein
LTTRHYVVAPHGGLANVFVYVKSGLEGRSFPLSTNRPVLDQTNAGFYPYVIGVMTNQTLLIKNSEPYMDNPMATPSRNKEFNLGQPVTGMISPVRFDQPEVLIRVKCGVHAWEFAFVGVVESPFFGVSGTNGDYRLPPDLPPGRYVIEAVHPKAGRVTKEVVLGQDEKRSLDFTMEVPAKPPTPAR